MANDRYLYTTRTKDDERKFRKFNSTLYPKIEPSDDDIFVISNTGERLDLLAFTYYGDVTLWWVIAQANNIGKGTLNILPGIQLRIPQNLEPIYSSLETINRTR